jgi:hypothetical protein
MIRKHLVPIALALTLGAVTAHAENAISTAGLKATSSAVTVGSVMADKAGYLVVHATDESGTMPGTVIGNTPVQPGEHSDVAITLAKPLKAGTKLIVMLHEEGDNDTDFDSADKPATAGRGPVQQFVTVE